MVNVSIIICAVRTEMCLYAANCLKENAAILENIFHAINASLSKSRLKSLLKNNINPIPRANGEVRIIIDNKGVKDRKKFCKGLELRNEKRMTMPNVP